jgi:hypothetical protein
MGFWTRLGKSYDKYRAVTDDTFSTDKAGIVCESKKEFIEGKK